MNKQELINRYTEKLLTQSNSLSQAVQESRNAIFRNVIADLESLDEPQKVKVPLFMKEFLDFCNKHEQNGLEAYHGLFNICSSWPKDDILQWSFQDPYRFINAFQYGFEVEEEPKWVVKRKNFYFQKFTGFKFGANCHEAKSEAVVFTEKQKAEAVALLIDGTVEKV